MARKKDDIEEEVERLARKSNFKMRRTEYSFDKQLEKLDTEIDILYDDKVKSFDDYKESTEKYMGIEFKHDLVDRYREKLKKI